MNPRNDLFRTSRRTFLRTGALAAIGLPVVSGSVTAKRGPKSRRPGTVPVFPSDVSDASQYGDGATFYRVAEQGAVTDEFVKGPGEAPFGSGSLQFTISDAADRLFYYNYDYGLLGDDPVALADVTELSYSTYTDSDTVVPALKMEIDPNDPANPGYTYATLNFEPYYNNTVTPGVWQTWDVLTADAGLWLTGTSGAGSISQPVTWDELLGMYPNATIKYGFGVGVGSGWEAFEGNVDDLRIGVDGKTTRYNFEARGNSGSR